MTSARLLLLLLFFAIFSCRTSTRPAETLFVNNPIESVDDACFRLKMEKWFIVFHEQQEKGSDLFEADMQARAQADAAFQACLALREEKARGNESPELKTARK